MKRLLKIILSVIIACAVAAFALSCTSDGEITSFSVKYEAVRIKIGEKIKGEQLYEKEGGGKVLYTVENPDILSADGGIITGLAEGVGYIHFKAGEFSGRVKITVYDGYKVNAELKGATFTYDGTVKNLTVTGLPDGSEIKYYVDGREFFGATDPGKYTVTAEVTLPDGYRFDKFTDVADLIIERAVITPDVKLVSESYEYDGTEKVIELIGELPDGVTVTLINNKATDVGVYGVKANFTVNEKFYQPIMPLTATLTIRKKGYNIDFTPAENRDVKYDGTNKFVPLVPSEGLTVDYFVYDNAVDTNRYIPKEEYETKYADRKPFVNSGSYRVKAVFSALEGYEKNYAVPSDREYVIAIEKADFYSNLKWKTGADISYDVIYDGLEKLIGYSGEELIYDGGLVGKTHGVNGEFPDGAEVFFFLSTDRENKVKTLSFTDAGRYYITATFVMPTGSEKNYNKLPDTSYTYIIKKADRYNNFTFDGKDGDVIYKDKEVEYDGKVHRFSLVFKDPVEEEKFSNDVTVEYSVKKDGALYGGKSFEYATVRDAGSYEVFYKLSFREPVAGDDADKNYIDSLKKNYILPHDGGFKTVVLRKTAEVGGVKFAETEFTYDGQEKTVLLSGEISPSIEAAYENNSFVNAGTYEVKAVFHIIGDLDSNYIFTNFGKQITSISATVTVNKADYDRSTVTAPEVSGGVYDPNKTLADYALPENFRWFDPEITPECSKEFYEAIFNADPTNYNDLTGISIGLKIEKKPIDLSGVYVNGGFLPYTGKEILPKAEGEGGEFVKVSAKCEVTAVEIGKYTFTDLLVAPINGNYILTGEGNFGDVEIYVYDGKLYDYKGYILYGYKGMEREVTLPAGTKGVHKNAFVGKDNIYSLTIPDTVEALPENISGLTGLRVLTVPFIGRSAVSVGADGKFLSVFNSSQNIEEIYVTNSSAISADAFNGCKSVKKIEYENAVTSVGDRAFYNCESLRKASFPQVETVGKLAFYGCKGLKELALTKYFSDGNTVADLFGTDAAENSYSLYSLDIFDLSSGSFETVAPSAFKNLSSLSILRLPHTVKSIGYRAFDGVKAEISFYKDGVVTAGEYGEITDGMFYGYKGATLTLPSTATAVGREAFKEATNLTEIILPAGITTIGENAFYGVSAKITFTGVGYTTVQKRAFAGYAGAAVNFPSSVSNIQSYAFYGARIKSVTVGSGITLENNVFENCDLMTTATINCAVVPSAAFLNCASLKKLYLNGVTEIKGNAFNGCVNLSSVEFPATIGSVSSGAFLNCPALSLLVFKGGVPTFGEKVFTSNVKIEVYADSSVIREFSEVLKPSYPSMTFFSL